MKNKFLKNNKIKIANISGITTLCICVALGFYLYFQSIHVPTWMSYPYDVTIYKGKAKINAYLAEEREISIPKRILGAKVCVIEDYVFDDKADIIILNIPESVTEARFIYHHDSQTYYHLLPDNKSRMREYMGNEKEVVIPKEVWGRTVTETQYSFIDTDVEKVVIPDTVTYIGIGSFEGCKNLKEIILPSQLKDIEADAFKKAGIESIYFPDSVDYIGTGAFELSCIEEVAGLENVESIGNSAFRGTPWEEKIEGNFVCIDDILYLYRGNTSEVLIPSFVKEIRGAFYIGEDYPYPCNVKKVFIPDSVTAISAYSFGHQDDIEVYIPSSVVSLGEYAPDASFISTIFTEPSKGESGTIVTTAGSPAESYAIKQNVPYRIITEEEMKQEMESAKHRLSSYS